MNETVETVEPIAAGEWQTVCRLDDIVSDAGICALIGNQQVAIFRHGKTDALFAISNYDPIGEANVLSRGIIGSIEERLVVASPLYKQHYDLRTGQCVEDQQYSVATFPVRVRGGDVQLFSRH